MPPSRDTVNMVLLGGPLTPLRSEVFQVKRRSLGQSAIADTSTTPVVGAVGRGQGTGVKVHGSGCREGLPSGSVVTVRKEEECPGPPPVTVDTPTP